MNEIPQITLSFVENHPQKAARILERLAVEDTLSFIEKIPPKMGSKILSTLAPQYAGQCFLALNPNSSAALMQNMPSSAIISILRLVPSSALSSYLDLLSAQKNNLLKTRLSFPPNSVGAWMDSDNPPVLGSLLVGDLRKSLRNSKYIIEYVPCVVKPDGTVAGLISLSILATAKGGSDIAKIMSTDFKPISDRDSLKSAALSPDWDRFDALPVTNRKGLFVGMLTQKNLNRGMSLSMKEDISHQTEYMLEDFVNAYISTLSWLVRAVVSSPIDSIINKKVSNDR